MRSISRSAFCVGSSRRRPYSVGTMPDLPRTSRGSPVMSRRRLSAALMAGCDWLSLTAARVTLRSISKVCKTRNK